MATEVSDFWWHPFPSDWSRARNWREYLRRDRVRVELAIGGLVEALPDRDLYRRNLAHHQLATDWWARSGRWRMLEAGAMVAALSSVGDYTERLLNAGNSYMTTCAELRGGLLLRCLGFDVERDPAHLLSSDAELGSGRPDWSACRNRHRFGAEVKCPDISDRAEGQMLFSAHVVHTLAQLLPSGVGAQVSLNPATLADAAIGRWANKNKAEALVLKAAAEAEASGCSTSELGAIAHAASNGMKVGPIVVDDESYELERLRGHMQDAAYQLTALPYPGIIIVDGSLDYNVTRRCCDIAEMMREGWARRLAAVLLVLPTLPGAVVTTVVGPRFADWVATSPTGMRLCSGRRVHVDTFGGAAPCKHDVFDDCPPLCLAGMGHR